MLLIVYEFLTRCGVEWLCSLRKKILLNLYCYILWSIQQFCFCRVFMPICGFSSLISGGLTDCVDCLTVRTISLRGMACKSQRTEGRCRAPDVLSQLPLGTWYRKELEQQLHELGCTFRSIYSKGQPYSPGS